MASYLPLVRPPLAIVGVAMLVLGSGCRRPVATQDAPGEVPVEVMQVSAAPLEESTVLTGVLEAIRGVDVVSEVAGRVERLEKDTGQPVKAGEVLASLDARVPQEALNQARAALLAAEARYALARQDLARDSTLYAHGDIPDAAFEASRMAYTAALAERNAARAARELAERNLRETRIRAPFSGVVARRFVDLGTYVTPGMPVFRVVDIDSLRLVLHVAQHHVARVTRGASVRIALDGGESITGRIRSVSPEADPLTKTFPVEVVLANTPDRRLRGGQVVQATLTLGAVDSGVAVPREAVVRRTGTPYVFVVTDSVAHQRRVWLGPLIGDRYVIQDGLSPGEWLVVVGAQNLNEGSPVSIQARHEASREGAQRS